MGFRLAVSGGAENINLDEKTIQKVTFSSDSATDSNARATDDVIPDVLGNKNIIDVSTPEKARAAGLKRGRPYSNAVSSKEVLVEGRVPANKLTITCPG